MQNNLRRANLRWMQIAVVAFIWLFFGTTFARQWSGDSQIWKRDFGVTRMSGPFADLSQIPSAVKAQQHGLDPYVSSPYDVDQRPFVYPRLWMYIFSALRITPERLFGAGIVVACCFLLAVSWLVSRQSDVWACIAIGLITCSSASAFAVERGNTDILMFCLVMLAIELESRGGYWALVLGTFLKFYPFFALLGHALTRRRNWLVYVALALGVVGILAQRKVVGLPGTIAPHGYGIREIDVMMERAPAGLRASFDAHPQIYRAAFAFWLAALAGSGVVAGGLWGRRRLHAEGLEMPVRETLKSVVDLRSKRLRPGGLRTVDPRSIGLTSRGPGPQEPAELEATFQRNSYAFLLCACVFMGTFLASTSYAYRLIFLIPLTPFLVSQVRRLERVPQLLGIVGLLLIWFGVNRGTVELVPSHRLLEFIKVGVGLDLWALLWVVSFFVGLIAVMRYSRQDPVTREERVGLIREPA